MCVCVCVYMCVDYACHLKGLVVLDICFVVVFTQNYPLTSCEHIGINL